MTRRSLHREDELTFHRASADQPEGLAGALEGQRAEDPRGNPSGLSSLQSTWKSSAYGRVLRQCAPEPPPVRPPITDHACPNPAVIISRSPPVWPTTIWKGRIGPRLA